LFVFFFKYCYLSLIYSYFSFSLTNFQLIILELQFKLISVYCRGNISHFNLV